MEFGIYELFTLIGALGFFIYGMKVMSDGIQKVAGSKMRGILSKMTSNRFLGVATGFLITALLQSSSATTVMIVSFVNAGLLTLVESIGVIMGANVGTTITAWLISLLGFKVKISAIALPIIAIGMPMMFSSNRKMKSWAEVLIGFALLFMGLDHLKGAVPDLQANSEFLSFLANYANMGIYSTLMFIGVGTMLTLIVQSSSAAMAITLIMCNMGYIPFELAAAMVLGENIGTTITANVAAVVGNVHAKRAAKAHFIFNIFGVIWMIIAFSYFITSIDGFMQNNKGFIQNLVESNAKTESLGDEMIFNCTDTATISWITANKGLTITEYKTAKNSYLIVNNDFANLIASSDNEEILNWSNNNSEIAASIATIKDVTTSPLNNAKAVPIGLSIFHTLFNIINLLLLVWFVPLISRIVIKMQPSKGDVDEEFHLEHIGSGLMQTSELSVLEAKKEVSKFGRISSKLFKMIPELMTETDNKKFNNLMSRIKKYEDITDRMEVEIADYLAEAAKGELSDTASKKVRSMLSIVNDMERIGDICYQMSITIERKNEQKAYFTPELRTSLEEMIAEVLKALEIMNKNLNSEYKQVSMADANGAEDIINKMRNKLRKEYLTKIEKGEVKIQTGMIYNNLIHSLEKVGDHVHNITEAITGN
ncbi:MAG: Na/Pi cotransporter family protein [Flavobacteriales bacterium]|nr:Na/Pi cotransporter family protein [Flavobacteriales bacterium]MBT6650519.1 Na/Pi cotransporter family protein [Flavobacteriales bacterium]